MRGNCECVERGVSVTASRPVDASSATISERLADHVVGLRLEDVPTPVVQKTKDHLVHHLGLALRGVGSESVRSAVGLAHELSGEGGSCTIIGERKADLLEAVLANGMLMTHDGMDDFQLPPGVHPGAVVLPAALAVGEVAKASGRDLLTAVIAGYDVMGKLCGPVWSWERDVPRRPNNVVGPMGAAATAARLLGLSRTQTVHALGHAGQAAMGIAEGVEHIWTMHPLLARNGVLAAMLAKAGTPASPTIIEGKHGIYRSLFLQAVPDSLWASLETLGADFEISKTETKRISASALNFVAIELTQQLVSAHRLDADRIKGVTIALPEERRTREGVWEQALADDDPMGRRGALRFRIAMIITDGRTVPARYAQRPDDTLRALLDRIQIRWEGDRPLRYTKIEVTTTDGDQRDAVGDQYVAPPLDWSEWLAEGGRAVFTDDRLARLAELIRHLENVTDVSEVMANVAGPRAAQQPESTPALA
jgi:2-methylcitrate dehydratase PrpD